MYNYIVDTHCHLDLIEQKNIQFAEILQNCQKNNVKILQTICTKFSNFDKILAYSFLHESIYCSVGLHPCYVSLDEFRNADEIIEICQSNSKIIGIGETGLDYFHDQSNIALQKKSFEEHIIASSKTKLPTIIHARNCDNDMIEMLSHFKKQTDFPAILHCFSSTKELAFKALDLGLLISIAGIVTFKNAKELQEIVKNIPLEFLLVETDSPYLAPEPNRGAVNQPALIADSVNFIAQLKNISSETLIAKTTENFHRFFTRAKIVPESN